MIKVTLDDVMGTDLSPVMECSVCGNLKLYPSQFYKKSSARGGFCKHCKDCHKETSKRNRKDRHSNDPFREKHYNLKSSANYQGVEYSLDAEYLKSIWTGRCSIFGLDIHLKTGCRSDPYHAEVDKIIPKYGYVKGNVQWVSHRANRLKDNATIDELEKVLENMRKHLL